MDQRIKDDWVALLRYGGLKQETGNLRNMKATSFCCLGVLCELAKTEGVVERYGDTDYEGEDKDGDSSHGFGVLPDVVMEWAGLEYDNPTPKDWNKTLSTLNDNGKTFPEIADIIEKGL